MSIKEKVLGLCEYSDEQAWFEFKENWFEEYSEVRNLKKEEKPLGASRL